MLHRLKSLEARYNELLSLLAREDVARDFNQYKSISQELSQLEPVVKAFQEYLRLEEKLREDREILKEGGDKELKELAEGEIKTLTFESEGLEREIRSLLLKNDPDGRRDIIVEIRAGTGGEEAALFASELYRMYFRLAEKKLWKAELLNINNSDLKGIKEVVFSISGENVYARLQYESGVHRVQRVPQTEASGRISHLNRNRGGSPRSRRGGRQDRPERPENRCLRGDRAGGTERQPELHGHPYHPLADEHGC